MPFVKGVKSSLLYSIICMLIIIEVTAQHLNETCKPGLNYKTLKMPFYIILAWEY